MRCRFVVFTVFVAFGLNVMSVASAQDVAFWLSPIGTIGGGAAQPANLDAIPLVTHSTSETDSSLFLWGRPAAAQIVNWSMLAISDSNLVTFEGPDIYNPSLSETHRRWEYTFPAPTDTVPASTTMGSLGFNLDISGFGEDVSGIGLGDMTDPLYDAAIDAWLVAEFPYSLSGLDGTAGISLQIGANGISAFEMSTGDTNVTFGVATDPALNGSSQRLQNSLSVDAIVEVIDQPVLPCDYVNPGMGCDIDDLDALYAGTNGAPSPVSTALINQWLADASRVDNPAKSHPADTYRLGDIDLDGDVDSTDLGMLLNRFGDNGDLRWRDGDLDASMVTDSSDLGNLLNNFSSGAIVVPEPTQSLVMLLVGFLAMLRYRHSGTRFIVFSALNE